MSAIQQRQAVKRATEKTTAIPPPFQAANASLKPLLAQCDPTKVYLLHIDRHSPEYKRNIFLIPLLLNGTIGLLLLWRLWVAVPQYLALLLALFGRPSSATEELITAITRRRQVGLVLRRAGMVLFDFVLFRFIGPWPITFFAEQPSNPVLWRWKLGFKREEVIARVSRGWESKDLMQGVKKGGESPWFKTRVLPAIDTETMSKTGYLLMDRSWDLDFELMLDAHMLLDRGQLHAKDADGIALTHIAEPVGWCQWRWNTQEDSDQELRNAVERLKSWTKNETS